MVMINDTEKNFRKFKKNEILLKKIAELSLALKGKCFYIFFGGFAVDAYHGQITRFHEDIDLICWREDIPIIKKELKKLGYNIKFFSHPQEKKLIYKFHTADKNKTYSFQIADRVDKNNFEISFWFHIHLKFPIKYLSVQWKKINLVKFPVVSKNFLIELKRRQSNFYKQETKNNFERYLFKQGSKHLKTMRDLKILLEKNNCIGS